MPGGGSTKLQSWVQGRPDPHHSGHVPLVTDKLGSSRPLIQAGLKVPGAPVKLALWLPWTAARSPMYRPNPHHNGQLHLVSGKADRRHLHRQTGLKVLCGAPVQLQLQLLLTASHSLMPRSNHHQLQCTAAQGLPHKATAVLHLSRQAQLVSGKICNRAHLMQRLWQ